MLCVPDGGGNPRDSTFGELTVEFACLLLFHRPAFGPLMMNAIVHRDRPRRHSGSCVAAVRNARESMKARLSSERGIEKKVCQ